MAIRNYGIPFKWSAEVDCETAEIPSEITYCDSRVDLRSIPLITIDGEDARDFDDAVFCQPKPEGGWELIVAIADVSHYVTVGSELDKEAFLAEILFIFPAMWCPCCLKNYPMAYVRSILLRTAFVWYVRCRLVNKGLSLVISSMKG